jgi:hypothetical protein
MYGAVMMDSQLAFDTFLVVWVLGLALYIFSLGRFLGARRSSRSD